MDKFETFKSYILRTGVRDFLDEFDIAKLPNRRLSYRDLVNLYNPNSRQERILKRVRSSFIRMRMNINYAEDAPIR